MAQYMLSVHHDGPLPELDLAELQPIFDEVDRFNTALVESGRWVFGGGLMPRETATMVDATGPAAVVTDGPFAESKEYLGGFWVVDVPDVDSALEIAAEASRACRERVEVRAFQAE